MPHVYSMTLHCPAIIYASRLCSLCQLLEASSLPCVLFMIRDCLIHMCKLRSPSYYFALIVWCVGAFYASRLRLFLLFHPHRDQCKAQPHNAHVTVMSRSRCDESCSADMSNVASNSACKCKQPLKHSCCA